MMLQHPPQICGIQIQGEGLEKGKLNLFFLLGTSKFMPLMHHVGSPKQNRCQCAWYGFVFYSHEN